MDPAGQTNGNLIDDAAFERDLNAMLSSDGSILNNTSSLASEDPTAGDEAFTGINLSSPAHPGQGGTSLQPTGYSSSPSSPAHGVYSNYPGQAGGAYPAPLQRSSSLGNNQLLMTTQQKMESLRKWGVSTFKCTRQILAEKMGRGSRTVDLQLEGQIEVLRDTQRKYTQLLSLSRAMSNHFSNLISTQRQLSEVFSELGQRSPELQEEFEYNTETQRALMKNGEALLAAIAFFISSVNTLCNKTMEDTLLTVKQYEAARLEYDAYRCDLETLVQAPKTDQTAAKQHDVQLAYQQHKDKFDKLRQDVSVKLKFLEENKVKVMHKQLVLFHNAMSAYFTGNQTTLDQTLKQFSIKLKQPQESTSFLEQ